MNHPNSELLVEWYTAQVCVCELSREVPALRW